jgi:hypothetical protein
LFQFIAKHSDYADILSNEQMNTFARVKAVLKYKKQRHLVYEFGKENRGKTWDTHHLMISKYGYP